MMTEISSQAEDSKNRQFPKEKEETVEQQDEQQSSTAASNLNTSIDNLSPKNMRPNLDITEEIALSKRKLSAPISFSQNMRFNIEKLGKGPKRAYYDKLLCKGFFN